MIRRSRLVCGLLVGAMVSSAQAQDPRDVRLHLLVPPSPGLPGGPAPQLSFFSGAGVRYQVETCDNLSGWRDFGPAVEGFNAEVSLPGAAVGGPVFYRLRWEHDGPLFPPLHTLVSVGDSITDASYRQDTYGTWQPAARGWAAPMVALLGQRLRPLPVTNARKSGDLDNGYSGIQAGQFQMTGMNDGVNPFRDAVALNTPNTVYVVHIGTNDIWEGDAAPVTAARVVALWRAFVAAGCRVVGTSILPRTAAYPNWNDGLRQKVVDINTILAASWREAGLEGFRDWYALVDLDENGFAQPWELPDTIHPIDRVSWKMAHDMAGFLAPYVAGSASLIPANDAPEVLSQNPAMLGGTTIAPSWAVKWGTASKIVDPDGTVWQRLSNQVPAMDGYSKIFQSVPVDALTPGSRVRLACTARFSSLGNGASGVQIETTFYGTPQRTFHLLRSDYTSLAGAGIPDFAEAVFVSEPFEVPVTPVTSIQMTAAIFGSGNLDVRDYKLFTVP